VTVTFFERSFFVGVQRFTKRKPGGRSDDAADNHADWLLVSLCDLAVGRLLFFPEQGFPETRGADFRGRRL
jgi:hypothetical protein